MGTLWGSVKRTGNSVRSEPSCPLMNIWTLPTWLRHGMCGPWLKTRFINPLLKAIKGGLIFEPAKQVTHGWATLPAFCWLPSISRGAQSGVGLLGASPSGMLELLGDQGLTHSS